MEVVIKRVYRQTASFTCTSVAVSLSCTCNLMCIGTTPHCPALNSRLVTFADRLNLELQTNYFESIVHSRLGSRSRLGFIELWLALGLALLNPHFRTHIKSNLGKLGSGSLSCSLSLPPSLSLSLSLSVRAQA